MQDERQRIRHRFLHPGIKQAFHNEYGIITLNEDKMTVINDFQVIINSVNEAEKKLTYNMATIDSEIKRLKESGFKGKNTAQILKTSKQWLEETYQELDKLETEMNNLESEVINKYNEIINKDN